MDKHKTQVKKGDQLEFPDGTQYQPEVEVKDPRQLRSAHFWKNLNQLGFMMAIAIVVGAVPGAFILNGTSQSTQQLQQFPVELGNPPQETCVASGGEWKEFPNVCADTCEQYTQEQLCKQTPIESCDCGPDSCFNGQSCVTNPESPLISNTGVDTDEL